MKCSHIYQYREKKICSDCNQPTHNVEWSKENKMLARLRWKMRGQPVKNEWWSI